ncbi:MAG TPA: hypothetical protein VKA57_13850 [Solirubrobacteraceae bacterium]|nr:hypothetical protein [Solirubrobacteraceae bacterium]
MEAEGNLRLRSAAIWVLIALITASTVALYLLVVRDLPAYTEGIHVP